MPLEKAPSAATWPWRRSLGVLVLSCGAVAVPKLALPAVLLVVLAIVALPMGTAPPLRRPLYWLLGGSAVLACVALVRFVALEALSGVVDAGSRASSDAAVSLMREVLFAQDTLRRQRILDPDGDGLGSAGFLGELTGLVPLRGGQRLDPPPLSPYRLRVGAATPLGPAGEAGGFLFLVCLPAAEGGWTARPEAPVNEALAGRSFQVLAWPSASNRHLNRAYSLDEHERILESVPLEGEGPPRWYGPLGPPPCDAALAPGLAHLWHPWKKKKPRTSLPGEQ